jgi:hypothetical protein
MQARMCLNSDGLHVEDLRRMVAACTGPQVITDEIPMQGDMESLQTMIGAISVLRSIGGARKKSSRTKQVRPQLHDCC